MKQWWNATVFLLHWQKLERWITPSAGKDVVTDDEISCSGKQTRNISYTSERAWPTEWEPLQIVCPWATQPRPSSAEYVPTL